MTRWIDGPDWNGQRGQSLVRLLAGQYREDAAIEPLLGVCDIWVGLLPNIAEPELRWFAFAKSLHSKGLLGRLLDEIARDRPALADRLAGLVEADATPILGNPPDPSDLRSNLRVFFSDDNDTRLNVLIVRGPERCGKSFSFQLIKHIAGERRDLKLVHIDFSPAALGNRAVDLMSIIYARLGMPDLTANTRDTATQDTTTTRYAANLVNEFVGAYRPIEGATRILVIDGLNRVDLNPNVQHLVAGLAVEVVRDQLPATQLVLMGYGGAFDQELTFDVLTEDVAEITQTHVRLFFEGLVPGRPLASEELENMVREAMIGADKKLDILEKQVRDTALRLVGTP
jgi:hypothetical protein